MMPPMVGATENSQSWPTAQPSWAFIRVCTMAGPVERAGFTEVGDRDAVHAESSCRGWGRALNCPICCAPLAQWRQEVAAQQPGARWRQRPPLTIMPACSDFPLLDASESSTAGRLPTCVKLLPTNSTCSGFALAARAVAQKHASKINGMSAHRVYRMVRTQGSARRTGNRPAARDV